MTVTERPFTDDERRECLRWLVVTPTGHAVRQLVLAGWAHESLDDATRQKAWLEFAYRWRVYLQLQDGTRSWQDVYPDLLHGDRDQAALVMALQEADDALDVLVDGKPQ